MTKETHEVIRQAQQAVNQLIEPLSRDEYAEAVEWLATHFRLLVACVKRCQEAGIEF